MMGGGSGEGGLGMIFFSCRRREVLAGDFIKFGEGEILEGLLLL